MGRMVIAMALVLTGCAAGRGWTAANTAMELGFAGEVAIDAYQTARYILPACAELNPIVGRCGDRVPLGVYVPVGLVLHAAVAWALPPRLRNLFQIASLGIEGAVIGVNWSTQDDRFERHPPSSLVK